MSHNRLLCCVLPRQTSFESCTVVVILPMFRPYPSGRPTRSNGSLAPDRLAFDDNPETERLRRFDLSCGRGLAHSLDSLLKLRRAPEWVDRPSSVLPDPLSAAGDTLESIATPNETNEPTDVRENVASEPTLSADVGLESPSYMKARE